MHDGFATKREVTSSGCRQYAARVTFVLLVEVDGLTEAQGQAIEQECQARNTWPVHYRPPSRITRWLQPSRGRRRSLHMPDRNADGQELLDDNATWDAPAWSMTADVLRSLAEAMHVLGANLPQGFTFRATWSGPSEVRHEVVLTADELADLAGRSQLNEFTLYVVSPRE